MAVLVLMYHRTLASGSLEHFDVALDKFFDQINRLIDSGVSFVRFADVNDPEYLGKRVHVALTFDDGHASNGPAFEFLDHRGIVPTAFIVRAFAETEKGFLKSSDLKSLAPICDFGSHGSTHKALTNLADGDLAEELRSSRQYLEDTLGRSVKSMALPGGRGDARVMDAARRCGFNLVGNSIADIHHGSSQSINRMCITRSDGARYPLELALARPSFWMAKRVRRAALNSAQALLGNGAYSAIADVAKQVLGGRR